MKRNILILHIFAIICCLLVGCGRSVSPATPRTALDGSKYDPGTLAENRRLYGASVNASEQELLAVVQTYARSGQASESFRTAAAESEEIRLLPVYDADLGETGYVCVCFYRDSELTATRTVAASKVEETVQIEEIPDFRKIIPSVTTPLSDENCFTFLSGSPSDFRVTGLIYDLNPAWMEIYPIGYSGDKETLSYLYNEPYAFTRVDPFRTVEEGRTAIAAYNAERADILSRLPVYPWEDDVFLSPNGYLYTYMHRDIVNDTGYQGDGGYLYWDNVEYDGSAITIIPLLGEDGEEDVSVLHLLYYHNQLIAELVLNRVGKGADSVFRCALQREATKDEAGNWIPLGRSIYETELERLKERVGDRGVAGICYVDGAYQAVLPGTIPGTVSRVSLG